jgi:hypothetical protein
LPAVTGSSRYALLTPAAYHKGHLQVRHWLNITREVTHLRQLKELG